MFPKSEILSDCQGKENKTHLKPFGIILFMERTRTGRIERADFSLEGIFTLQALFRPT